jgi:hypothetical protein
MKPNRRVLFALLLAVTSGLAACEQSDGLGDLTGPTAQPQFSSNNGNGNSNGRSRQISVLQRTNALTGDVTYTSSPVGPQGALLSFGSHTLFVPKQAVRHWTVFTATLRAGDEIRIDLRARDMFGEVTTFKKQVQLTLDLSDAIASDNDLATVAIYYLAPDGTLEKMPSALNQHTRSVTGFLDHFSDYIPGTLRNEPPTPPQP